MNFREKTNLSVSKKEIEQDVYELLIAKEYYQAFKIAKNIENEGSVKLLINMAVCLNAGGFYKKAIFYLNKAFSKIHTFKNVENLNLSAQDLSFIRAENEVQTYMLPINPKFEFSKLLLEIRIDLFCLDLYILCGKEQKALDIINKYQYYNFYSVMEASKKLKNRR